MPETRGIALIAVIILILVTAIVMAGLVAFISNSLALNTIRASAEQALYAAQAGVYAAVYDYSVGAAWDRATDVNIAGSTYYCVGGRGTSRRMADFLRVDADNPQITNSSGTDRLLQRIGLSNLNPTQAITIDGMMVEWANFGGALNRVRLGDDNYAGSWGSGVTFPVGPFTLGVGSVGSFTNDNDNSWRFNTAILKNAIIVVTFFFTDGSSRRAYLYNNGRSGNNEFLITSTGEVRGQTTWKRTIEATYDVGVSRITSWQETEQHL